MRFPALVRYIKMQHICIAFSFGLLLAGCLNTEGTLEIKGKVIDEYTKKQIPGRDIIVQGIIEKNNSSEQFHRQVMSSSR